MLNREQLMKLKPVLESRIKVLSEIKGLVEFLDDVKLDRKLFKNPQDLLSLRVCLTLNQESVEKGLRDYAKTRGLKVAEVFRPIRIAISGKEISLPLFESMEVLGEEEWKSRIGLAIDLLQN